MNKVIRKKRFIMEPIKGNGLVPVLLLFRVRDY